MSDDNLETMELHQLKALAVATGALFPPGGDKAAVIDAIRARRQGDAASEEAAASERLKRLIALARRAWPELSCEMGVQDTPDTSVFLTGPDDMTMCAVYPHPRALAMLEAALLVAVVPDEYVDGLLSVLRAVDREDA